jgi:hypothetical protein
MTEGDRRLPETQDERDGEERADPEAQDAGEHRFSGDAESRDGAAGASEGRTPGMGS